MSRPKPTYTELPPEWHQRILRWAEAGQIKEVYRWGDYHRRGARIPHQTVMEHVYGLFYWMSMLIRFLQPHHRRRLDVLLLMDAVWHHDWGEGVLRAKRQSRYDVSDVRKKDVDDLEENAAHVLSFIRSSAPAQRHYRRAFLLQFVVKKTKGLNRRDQRIVTTLAKQSMAEARIFRAAEILEYLAFAAYCTLKDIPVYEVVREVAAREVPKLDKLAADIPGFTETIWTKEFRGWLMQFIEKPA